MRLTMIVVKVKAFY